MYMYQGDPHDITDNMAISFKATGVLKIAIFLALGRLILFQIWYSDS